MLSRRAVPLRRPWPIGVLAVVAALVSAGCRKPPPEPAPLRSVKTYVFGSQEGRSTRRYAAQVRSVVRSSLAFQVAGRVVATPAGVGDRVPRGAVLARLDERPLQLRVQQARADAVRSEAAWAEAQRRTAAQRALLAEGFGTRQDLDQADAAETAARSAVESARSALELARRDAASAVLRAPHVGVVAARSVESFAEVPAGQVIFEIDGESGVEVVALVPVAVASQLRVGESIEARTDGSPRPLDLQVSAIGRRSTAAESVTVIARPRGADGPLLTPGRYAELLVAAPAQAALSTVPIEAVLPATEGAGAAVFVLDPQQRASRRPVELGPVTPEGVVVRSGLRGGEPIVAAGVGFLRDGEPVRVLKPPAR